MKNIIMIIAIVVALSWLVTIPQVMRHKTSDGYQVKLIEKSAKGYSNFWQAYWRQVLFNILDIITYLGDFLYK